MTYEEAIYTIEHGCIYRDKRGGEALKIAVIALEKQIPKKPKKKEENQYSTFYDCPCCGGYLMSKIDGELCCGQEYKCCFRCGQVLDWSDTE